MLCRQRFMHRFFSSHMSSFEQFKSLPRYQAYVDQLMRCPGMSKDGADSIIHELHEELDVVHRELVLEHFDKFIAIIIDKKQALFQQVKQSLDTSMRELQELEQTIRTTQTQTNISLAEQEATVSLELDFLKKRFKEFEEHVAQMDHELDLFETEQMARAEQAVEEMSSFMSPSSLLKLLFSKLTKIFK